MPDDQELTEAPDGQETVKVKKDLLVQQKIYDMILYAYPALEQMPKSQKFSLAQDMKHCMDKIMRLTIAANKKYTKRTTLQELDVEIAALKVYQIINPAFVRGYIEDSYACIKGRGSDAAAQRLFYFMQQDGRSEKAAGLDPDGKPAKRFYLQKLDTSKFFYRIDHQVSLDLVGRKCNYDPWLMWIMDMFVNAEGEKFGFPPGKGVKEISPDEMVADKGLAVGSLLNQMLANVNQNEVDHFAKRKLHIKQYVRYMDDIVMISDSKAQLREWRSRIEEFMAEKLKLELNPKKSFIQPISHGIDFCQYRIYPDHIRLKKATALRMKRNLKRIQSLYAEGKIDLDRAQRTVTSYMGLMSHCDSYQLRKAIFGEYSDTEWTEGWFFLKRDSEKIKEEDDG